MSRSCLIAVACLLSTQVAHATEVPSRYFGFGVGVNWLANGSSGSNVAGGDFNGTLVDIGGGAGFAGTVALGRRFSDLWRADVTYTYLNNSLHWSGSFPDPSRNTNFTGHASSSVVLANLYLHGRGLAPQTFGTIDPFIGAGIGIVWNHLGDVVEQSSDGTFTAWPDPGNRAGMAFRLGAGMDVDLTAKLTWTTSADFYWLGSFETGSARTKTSGLSTPINPWVISNVGVVSLTTGLRAAF